MTSKVDYLQRIRDASVYDVAVKSPLERAGNLSERLGNDIWLKREDLQPVFSFKLRGAYNKLAALDEGEKEGLGEVLGLLGRVALEAHEGIDRGPVTAGKMLKRTPTLGGVAGQSLHDRPPGGGWSTAGVVGLERLGRHGQGQG